MTTLSILTERIRLILNGGTLSDNDRVGDEEIRRAIVAACAHQLALTALNVNYNFDGGSLPDGLLVATYPGLEVRRGDAGISTVDLPVAPMILPENAGLYAVYPSGRPREPFLFVPMGVIEHWEGIDALNPIDAILMTQSGRRVEIYYDLLGANIPTVDARICTTDIDLLGDYDPLPIPADMEGAVITEVLQHYSAEPRTQRQEGREARPERGA